MNEQKPDDKKRKVPTSSAERKRTSKSARASTKGSAKAVPQGDAKSASDRTGPAYDKFEEAGQTLKNVLNEVTEKAEEMEKSLRQRLSESEISLKDELSRTEDKIRENPLLAVGIAAAAGLVVGLLLNRNQ